MSEVIKCKVEVSEYDLNAVLEDLITDDVMLLIQNTFAKMCDPYVPMDEGVLAQSLEITPEYVKYTQPYAHYQYTGDVYGPNIPIYENGEIVGWFSPPGQKKHPTGGLLSYNTEKHPLATKEWDKAMMADKGEEFIEQVREILVWRAKQLYG